MPNNFSSATVNLGVNTTQFNKGVGAASAALDDALKSMKLSADAFNEKWGGLTSGIKDTKRIVSGILVSQGFYALSNTLVNAGAAALAFSTNMETAAISMEYFVQGANKVAKAQAFLQTMNTFAARTPFSTEEAISLSKYMQAVGVSMGATKSFLKVITDTAAATGATEENLQRVVFGLGQMMTKGRLANEEIRQLANANIPIYEILQEQMGLTGKQISNIGRNWVGADKAVVAILTGLEQRYAGAADRISETVTGMTDTILDNAKIIAQVVSEGAYAGAKSSMTGLRDVLDTYREILSAGVYVAANGEKVTAAAAKASSEVENYYAGAAGLFEYIITELDNSGKIGTEILALIGNTKQLGESLADLYDAGKPLIDLFGQSLYFSLNTVEIGLTGMSKAATYVLEGLEELGITSGQVSEVLASLFITYKAAKWMALLGEAATAGGYAIYKMGSAAVSAIPAFAGASIGVKALTAGFIGLLSYGIAVSGILSTVSNSLAGLDTQKTGDNIFPDDYATAVEKYNKAMEEYNTKIASYAKDYEQPFTSIADGANSAGDALDGIADKSAKAAKKVKDSWTASFDEVYTVPDFSGSTEAAIDKLTDFGGLLSLPSIKFPGITTDSAIKPKMEDFFDNSAWDAFENKDVLSAGWWTSLIPWALVGATTAMGKHFSSTSKETTDSINAGAKVAATESAKTQAAQYSKIVKEIHAIDRQLQDAVIALQSPKTAVQDVPLVLNKLDQLIKQGDLQLTKATEYAALLDMKANEVVTISAMSEAKRISLVEHMQMILTDIDNSNAKLLDEAYRTSIAGENTVKEVKNQTKALDKLYNVYTNAYGSNKLLEELFTASNVQLNNIATKIVAFNELQQAANNQYKHMLDLLESSTLTVGKDGVNPRYNMTFLDELNKTINDFYDTMKTLNRLSLVTGKEVNAEGVAVYRSISAIMDDYKTISNKTLNVVNTFNTLNDLINTGGQSTATVNAITELNATLKASVKELEDMFSGYKSAMLATDPERVEAVRKEAEKRAVIERVRQEAKAIQDAKNAYETKAAQENRAMLEREAARLDREARAYEQKQRLIAKAAAAEKTIVDQPAIFSENNKLVERMDKVVNSIESTKATIKTISATLKEQYKQQTKLMNKRAAIIDPIKNVTVDRVETQVLDKQIKDLGATITKTQAALKLQTEILSQDQSRLKSVIKEKAALEKQLNNNVEKYTDKQRVAYEAIQSVVENAAKEMDTGLSTSLNSMEIGEATQALLKTLKLTTDEIAVSGTKLYTLMTGLGSIDGDMITTLVKALNGAGGLSKIGSSAVSDFSKLAMALGAGVEDFIAAYGSEVISSMGSVVKGGYAADISSGIITQIDRFFDLDGVGIISMDVKTMSAKKMEELKSLGVSVVDGIYRIAMSDLAKVSPEYSGQFPAQEITTGKNKMLMLGTNRDFDFSTISADFAENLSKSMKLSLEAAQQVGGRIFSIRALEMFSDMHYKIPIGPELIAAYKEKVVIPVFEATFGKGNLSAIQNATTAFFVESSMEELAAIRKANYGKAWLQLVELTASVYKNDNIGKYLKTLLEVETEVGKRIVEIDFAGAARTYKPIGKSANKWLTSVMSSSAEKFTKGALGPMITSYIDSTISSFNKTGDDEKFTAELQELSTALKNKLLGLPQTLIGEELLATSNATVADFELLLKAVDKIIQTNTIVSEIPRNIRSIIDMVTSVNAAIAEGAMVSSDRLWQIVKSYRKVADRLGTLGSTSSDTFLNKLYGMIEAMENEVATQMKFDVDALVMPFRTLGIGEALPILADGITTGILDGSLKVIDGLEASFDKVTKEISKSNAVKKLVLTAEDLIGIVDEKLSSYIIDLETAGVPTRAPNGEVTYPKIAEFSLKDRKNPNGYNISNFINHGPEENKRIYAVLTNIRDKNNELAEIAKLWLENVTVEDLDKGMPVEEFREFLEYLDDKVRISGFNSKAFDKPILNNFVGREMFVDGDDAYLLLQQKMGGLVDTLSGYFTKIFGEEAVGAHSALADVEMTSKLLEAISDGTVINISRLAEKIKGITEYTSNYAAGAKELFADAGKLYRQLGDKAIEHLDEIVKGINVYERLAPEVIFGTSTKASRSVEKAAAEAAAEAAEAAAEAANIVEAVDDLKTAATAHVYAAQATAEAAQATAEAAEDLKDAASHSVKYADNMTDFLKQVVIDPNARYTMTNPELGTSTIPGTKAQKLINSAVDKKTGLAFDLFDSAGRPVFTRSSFDNVKEASDNIRRFSSFVEAFNEIDSAPIDSEALEKIRKIYEGLSPDIVEAYQAAVLDIEDATVAYQKAMSELGGQLSSSIEAELGDSLTPRIKEKIASIFSADDLFVATSKDDAIKYVSSEVTGAIGHKLAKQYGGAIDSIVKTTITNAFDTAADGLKLGGPVTTFSDEFADVMGEQISNVLKNTPMPSATVMSKAMSGFGTKLFSGFSEATLGGVKTGGVGLVDVAAVALDYMNESNMQTVRAASLIEQVFAQIDYGTKEGMTLATAMNKLSRTGEAPTSIADSATLLEGLFGAGDVMNNKMSNVTFNAGASIGSIFLTGLLSALGVATLPALGIAAGAGLLVAGGKGIYDSIAKDSFSNEQLADFMKEDTVYKKTKTAGGSEEEAQAAQTAYEKALMKTRFDELNGNYEIKQLIYGWGKNNQIEIADKLIGDTTENIANRMLRLQQAFDYLPEYGMSIDYKDAASWKVALGNNKAAYKAATGEDGQYEQTEMVDQLKEILDRVFKGGEYDTKLGKNVIDAFDSEQEKAFLARQYGDYMDAYDLQDEYLAMLEATTGKDYNKGDFETSQILGSMMEYLNDVRTAEKIAYNAIARGTSDNTDLMAGDVSTVVAGMDFSSLSSNILTSLADEVGITLSSATESFTNSAGAQVKQIFGSISIDSDKIEENLAGWTQRLPKEMNLNIDNMTTDEVAVLAKAGIQINNDGTVTFMKPMNTNTTGTSREVDLKDEDISGSTEATLSSLGLNIDFEAAGAKFKIDTAKLAKTMKSALFMLANDLEGSYNEGTNKALSGLGRILDSGYFEVTNKEVLSGAKTIEQWFKSMNYEFDKAGNVIDKNGNKVSEKVVNTLTKIDHAIALGGKATAESVAKLSDGIVIKSPISEEMLTADIRTAFAAAGVTFTESGGEFLMVVNHLNDNLKDGMSVMTREAWDGLSKGTKDAIREMKVGITEGADMVTLDLSAALKGSAESVIAYFVEQPELWNALPEKMKQTMINLGIATTDGVLQINMETLKAFMTSKDMWYSFWSETYNELGTSIQASLTKAGIVTENGLMAIKEYVDASSIPEGVKYIKVAFDSVPDAVKKSMGASADALKGKDVIIYDATKLAFSGMGAAVTAGTAGAVGAAASAAQEIATSVGNAMLMIQRLNTIKVGSSGGTWFMGAKNRVGDPVYKNGQMYVPEYDNDDKLVKYHTWDKTGKATTVSPDAFSKVGTGGSTKKKYGYSENAFGGVVSEDDLYRAGEFGHTEAIIPLENRRGLSMIGAALANSMPVASVAQMQQLQSARGLHNGGVNPPTAASYAQQYMMLNRQQVAQTQSNQQQDSRPIVYVQNMIADKQGLRELENKLKVIRLGN